MGKIIKNGIAYGGGGSSEPATQTKDGLMSAADKTKLDGVAIGANKTTVTDNLTSTSTTNALSANQGKALKDSVDTLNSNLADKVEAISGTYDGGTYVTVDSLGYDATNKKLCMKVNGADTVVNFSSEWEFITAGQQAYGSRAEKEINILNREKGDYNIIFTSFYQSGSSGTSVTATISAYVGDNAPTITKLSNIYSSQTTAGCNGLWLIKAKGCSSVTIKVPISNYGQWAIFKG